MSMSALLGLTAAVCGPKVKVHTDYDMALNTYDMGVGALGSGKSVALGKLISNSTDLIYQDYGVKVLVESYSCAGLYKHHQENQNYCLVSSDEGGRLLSTISAKESRNEPERALLNKLWTGGEGGCRLIEIWNTGLRGDIVFDGSVYTASASPQ